MRSIALRDFAFLMFWQPSACSRSYKRVRAKIPGFFADARDVFREGDGAHITTAVLDAPMASDPFVPLFGGEPTAEETQKTISVVCLQRPDAGLPRQTVRSSRNTFLISGSQGAWRNRALVGKTVSSRVSQRLRLFAMLFA